MHPSRLIFSRIGLKKLIWLTTFALGGPAIIVWAFVILLQATSTDKPTPLEPQVLGYQSAALLAAGDETISAASGQVSVGDARPLIIKNYLEKYGSDLVPYSEDIVKISDQYQLDFRLLVAIAQQESNLCKKIPVDSYNCWGFGIYGDKVTRFENYLQGLNRVASVLKSDYLDKGLDTPEKIMAKYTPPSVLIGGPWAKGVNMFLEEME